MDNEEHDEKCGYCRNDLRHSVKEHGAAVKAARQAEEKRESALYRYAKHVYDTP